MMLAKRTGPFFTALLTLLTFSPVFAQLTTANPQNNSRWPLQIDTPNGQLTIYQPQPTKFEGDQLTGRAAVSILKPGSSDPVFGAIWLQSRVDVDRVNRTVQILEINVTKVRFPEGTNITTDTITNALKTAIPSHQMSLSLDQLLAMVEEVQQQKESVSQIDNTPPKIMFQTHPGVLLQYDGQPRFSQATNSTLLRAENTPFFVVEDPGSQTYFLKGAGRWFTARSAMGPFTMTGTVPENVSSLAESSGYQDPDQPLSDQQASQLEIIAATEPTELVWSDGPIQMGTIPNTNLLYVMNTDSDVFRTIDSQAWFVLLSGRWYTASNQAGPWTFVSPDKLPEDFRRIPPASAKARVLASIAGTQQSDDAVADTYVPQTAAIDRNNFQQPQVTYDGDPNFQPIEGTQMQYAVNTPDSVIETGGQYYCCSNGVWYNANYAVGPWGLCTAVPSEIYAIPPSCPLYPCRFCYVYGYTPEYCYVGYTPGYIGCYRHDHVVVYGTGWRYRPWIGRHFYARPFTYGFAAHYDPYTGFWGFDVGLDSDHGAYWIGAGPRFGTERGPFVRTAWFGHGGYRPPIISHDIYHNHDIFERPTDRPYAYNLYAGRRDLHAEFAPHEIGAEARGDLRSPDARIDIHPEPGGHLTPQQPEFTHRQDIYADPNGNIYRRTDAGAWEERNDHGWEQHAVENREPEHIQAEHVEPTRIEPEHTESFHSEEPRESGLNRDFEARQFGAERSQSYERSESVHSAPAESHFSGGGGGAGGGMQNNHH